MIFGGSNLSAPLCNVLGGNEDTGTSLTMQDGKLAIVGTKTTPITCQPGKTCEPDMDAIFALLDGMNLKSFAQYSYQIGGPRSLHSAPYGITGAGNGKLVVTGTGRYPNDILNVINRGKEQVITLGLAPPIEDVIFQNGFD